ncbi:hypothetical protein C2G38_2219241 [Gigaspora rosea]|uniref:Protein kinase domain-containing protein n=1 Tax=Gigaspora rosea TaxID=44941 RepID=A0A397U5Q2_9GLOM|nr:hypothetical protein C2G38_2219241 [Gigaspora rosea]
MGVRWHSCKNSCNVLTTFLCNEELKQTGDDDSTVMKWSSKLIKLKKLKNVKKCNDKDVMRLNVELDDVSGKIDHPNVLKVFGLTYDLHHYLRQTALSKSPLSWNDKLELVRQIVVGLKCLYDQSIVYAELHPYNIFVNDGVPKLANVAISKDYNVSLVLDIIRGVRESPKVGTPQEFINLYQKCWNHNSGIL